MTKRVLDVGNCNADHASLTRLVQNNFTAEIVRVHGPDDAFAALRDGGIDLVLVNRLMDRDHSEGLDIIKQIKQDPELAATPCMLITNYAEHQQLAVAAGAEVGFGKSQLEDPQTHALLAKFLAAE